VKLTGPFGTAYLRRIVPNASCSLQAAPALHRYGRSPRQPSRSCRSASSCCWSGEYARVALHDPGAVSSRAVSERHHHSDHFEAPGRHEGRAEGPADRLSPALSGRDIVFTAGAPAMVEAVARIAEAAGAKCYTDPFEPKPDRREEAGFLSRAADWFNGEMRTTSPPLSMADWPPQHQERVDPLPGSPILRPRVW